MYEYRHFLYPASLKYQLLYYYRWFDGFEVWEACCFSQCFSSNRRWWFLRKGCARFSRFSCLWSLPFGRVALLSRCTDRRFQHIPDDTFGLSTVQSSTDVVGIVHWTFRQSFSRVCVLGFKRELGLVWELNYWRRLLTPFFLWWLIVLWRQWWSKYWAIVRYAQTSWESSRGIR